MAEVRSLVVSRDARRLGLGERMVEELAARARREGFTRLCAFAHDPAFFVRRGFSIVPHTWVPEKIAHDCTACPLFRNCGQYAIVLELVGTSERSANVRRTAGERSPAVMSNLRPIEGGVTAPSGFRASGLHCGIKASGKPDLSLIVSDTPASAAGVFTVNLAKAAPLFLCQDHLAASGGYVRAIVTNSGCANACTGPRGEADAREMAQLTAAAVGCNKEHVLVASTGVIGVNLKMDAIRAGIPMAVKALATDGGAAAARAIMTTDPFPKEYAVEVTTEFGIVPRRRHGQGLGHDRAAHGHHARLPDDGCGGRSGDAARALTEAARYTFNAITVDGEPSTNDCVFALANGASGVTINENLYPALFEALPRGRARARARHRARRRGRDQADRDHRHRRGDGCRRVDGGARDCQLPARQDGGARRRSQLGPPGRGGRPLGRARSCSTAPACRLARWCCSRTAGPSTSSRRKAAEYLTGKDLAIEVESRRRRHASRHGLDLRPVRRIREDQRRIPNLTVRRSFNDSSTDLFYENAEFSLDPRSRSRSHRQAARARPRS